MSPAVASRPHCQWHSGWRADCDPCAEAQQAASDITSDELIPDDFILVDEWETPVAEETAHQANLDRISNDRGRALLAAGVLRETADHLEANANLKLTPIMGGGLLGILVAMMQESGWVKSAALTAFESVWGTDEENGDDGHQPTN